MVDELKKFLRRELEELKQNKARSVALILCSIVALIFWIADDSSSGEEVIVTEPPPVTKDLPVKVLPVEKSPDGVTVVLGANADTLLIADPFAGEEKPKPTPKPEPPKPSLPAIPPPVPIQSPPKSEQPQEQIILTGTAISGNNKTAMFLRGKETLFLTVGDEINGKKIIDITPDSVILDDGKVLTIRN